MPWRDRHGEGRVGPRELRQPSVKCPLGTEAPPQGPGRISPRSPPGLTCGAPPQASLAEASVGGFPPESEPVSSRARACPQPRRPTRGATHPRAAPMARPLAALRDPSLLLPALLSAAARPLTSHSVLRATPPRAQRAATPRPTRRPDAETPRPAHPPASLAACPPRSLSTLSLTVCPVKTLPGSRVPTTANPLSSLPPPRLRAPVVMATPPRALELEFGDLSSRARVSEDAGPTGATYAAHLSSYRTAPRVH